MLIIKLSIAYPTFVRSQELWHHGRVVKAVDSKSTGLRPQEFESPWCRFASFNARLSPSMASCQLSLVAEHLLRKQEVGSSILPVGFFFSFNLGSMLPVIGIMLVFAPCDFITSSRGLMDTASAS